MRFLILTALALAAISCTRAPVTCDRASTATISFSGASDTVTARTFGAACDKAVGVIAISAEDGTPLYAWSAPLHPTFGNLFEPRVDGPTAETADEFLARWAALRIAQTSEAPPWPARAPAPAGAETTMDRDLYEFIRARALPMACHLSAVAHETCVYFEPAAAAASPFLERDVIDSTVPENAPGQP